MFYGTGGIGKSLLGCMAPGPVAYVDLDMSLGVLAPELEQHGIDIPTLIEVEDWSSLRGALASSGWDAIRTIIIDPINTVEEWAIKHLLDTQKTFDKMPVKATTLEDYGYGKDVRLVYEKFILLLADLERHWVAGRNVILIAHECKPEENNPEGSNYIRWEPRLRKSKAGENSIRLKMKEWCDFVGRIGYDVASLAERGKDADQTKKATGQGTKTILFTERPQYMAKKRGDMPEQIDFGTWENPWGKIISQQ